MSQRERFSVIGKRIPLVDAAKKVTGEGEYPEDLYLPGMLYARILRSPHAHAKIVSIDPSAALAMPGVRAFVRGTEAPNKFGVLPVTQDETALAVDRVRYVGDCVAAVAADDQETADLAALRIAVEYQLLPPILRAQDALRETDDPMHERTVGRTNVMKGVEQHFGDVPSAFAQAEAVVEAQFDFPGLNHAFTEPHCVVAHWEADGRLTLWSPTQVPHYVHRALAAVLNLPMHQIRVIRTMIGGAFGGKSDPFPHEMIACLLARKTGKPVKLVMTREETFLTNHGRHPTQTRLRLAGSRRNGIEALDLDVLIDGGAWASFGVVTTYYNGVLSQGPYRIPSFRYRGQRAYTNKPPSGAMRGHGSVNTRFAIETLIDELAEKLGEDPCALRLRCFLPPNTSTVNQFRITSNGIQQGLEEAMRRSGWRERHGKLAYGHGVGVGCGFYISGSNLPIHWSKTPQCTVHLKVDGDGGVTAHSMAAEIGQGSDTVLAQVVAEELGLPINMIRVRTTDTDLAPLDVGSYSSRVTFMLGNAARDAAGVLREKLTQAARQIAGRPRAEFDFRDCALVSRSEPAVQVPYFAALEQAMADNGALIAKGWYTSPRLGGDFKGAAAGLSPTYSFSAFIAEVKVDPETGFVRVVKVWAAHDCGFALNPLAVEGQIEGSCHMGLGQALMEEMRYRKDNLLMNANFLDYKVPTAVDTPEIEAIIIESNDPEGPYGAKECGEGALSPVIPAVGNAIYDAVGVRLYRLPFTPERVLDAIEAKERAQRRAESMASVPAAPHRPQP
jgi:4-hydroxybenzoyl-CoA reductase subunit alpha